MVGTASKVGKVGTGSRVGKVGKVSKVGKAVPKLPDLQLKYPSDSDEDSKEDESEGGTDNAHLIQILAKLKAGKENAPSNRTRSPTKGDIDKGSMSKFDKDKEAILAQYRADMSECSRTLMHLNDVQQNIAVLLQQTTNTRVELVKGVSKHKEAIEEVDVMLETLEKRHQDSSKDKSRERIAREHTQIKHQFTEKLAQLQHRLEKINSAESSQQQMMKLLMLIDS
jgi:hypothetical protein